MGLFDSYIRGVKQEWAGLRSFLLGSGTSVSVNSPYWGLGDETYSPAEYGEYLSRSNGVYTCARLRSTLLSSLPLKLYRYKTGADRDEVETGAIVDLLTKVNPFWTWSRLCEMTELSLSLWGQAFWFLARGESNTGPPREIWWGRPDRVKIVPHPEEYISRVWYHPSSGSPIPFERGEFIWFRYPNPMDEYSGLSPLAAARIAADSSFAAMHANRNLFSQGMQLGGLIVPKNGQILTETQAQELETLIKKRYTGVKQAHRWGILRFEAEFKPTSFSPKDAEFINALKWGLEEIARAYGVPLDLIGGQRTYENVQAAERAIWINTIRPEARFIASEITEQLLPMFAGSDRADVAEFDFSDVEVLHESETADWERWNGQIQRGARTINEYRKEKGLDPVPWGDAWWNNLVFQPITGPVPYLAPGNALPPEALPTEPETPTEAEAERQALALLNAKLKERGIPAIVPTIRESESPFPEYGSDEHRALLDDVESRAKPHEKAFADMTERLLNRQKDAVLARLRDSERGKRDASDVAENPFDVPRWIREFRTGARPVIQGIVTDEGNQTLKDLGVAETFSSQTPRAKRIVETRAQRFAKEVNETTWNALRESLSEGIEEGEDVGQLGDRVDDVMGDRIRSSSETIARTEVIGGQNAGKLEGWRQSGVVRGKRWLAALDNRTRPTHVEAHGQVRNLDASFDVGGASGPCPGSMGQADEDINCRCTMTAVLDTD